MSMFCPSTSLTKMVLEVSPQLSSEMRLRKQMSESASFRLPETARKVLGEQIIGRIAMLSRHVAIDEPGKVIRFAEAEGKFDARFNNSLLGYLQISGDDSVSVKLMAELSGELYEWIREDKEAGALGLSVEKSKDGRFILLTCRRPEASAKHRSQE